MYFQKNCITSTKSVMKKVAIKGPINAFRMSLSSFFNIINYPACGTDHEPERPINVFDQLFPFSRQNL
jgi:hypothetical protein